MIEKPLEVVPLPLLFNKHTTSPLGLGQSHQRPSLTEQLCNLLSPNCTNKNGAPFSHGQRTGHVTGKGNRQTCRGHCSGQVDEESKPLSQLRSLNMNQLVSVCGSLVFAVLIGLETQLTKVNQI